MDRTYTAAEIRQRLDDRASRIRDSINGRLNDSLGRLRVEVTAESVDEGIVLRVNRDAICDWATEQVATAVHEVLEAVATELLEEEAESEAAAC